MRRIITGRVSSDKGDKTIVVKVEMRKLHPLYKKQYTRHSKFMAHDEKNEAKVGDLVDIRESKPMSAKKRFTLERIVERAAAGFEESVAAADVPLAELEKKEQPQPKPKTKKDELSAKNSQLSTKATKGSDK